MNSIFIVKELYPDYDIRSVHQTYELARKAAEEDHNRGFKLPFSVDEYRFEIDGGRPYNQWYLEEKTSEWRQVIKEGEWLSK
jgi:hypothetical protein